MKRKGTYGLLVLAVLLFASCMVGKKYEKPTTPSGISYPNATNSDTSSLATWFAIYHDTALQTLIKMAIDSNRDLLAAASRMQEALALSGAVKANMHPKLSYQAQGRWRQSRFRCNQGSWRCRWRFVECIWCVELGA